MLAHVPTVTTLYADAPQAAALLITAFGLLVLTFVIGTQRGLLPDGEVSFRRWIAIVVAGLSLGAASIHVAVIDAHFAEFAPYGIAFIVLAGFQVIWAAAYAVAPERSTAKAAILVNGGALAVWLTSRSVGLPFGPDSGLVEPIGSLDLTAGVLEVALIGVLAWDLGAFGRRTRPTLPRAGAAAVIGSISLGVMLLTTTAFVAAGGEPHLDAEPEPPAIGLLDPPPAPPTPTESAATPITVQPTPAGSSEPLSPAAPDAASTSPSPATPPSAPSAPPPAPTPTSDRGTAAPPTPRPTAPPTAPPTPAVNPGTIRFGTSLRSDGDVAGQTNEFRQGQTAVWVADLVAAPNAPTIRLFIVQILPDGREFEHWREDIPLADPSSRRLVGTADLSLYLHGGDGRHVMRYLGGDTLLAEGEFALIH